jgi:hypothetical protein
VDSLILPWVVACTMASVDEGEEDAVADVTCRDWRLNLDHGSSSENITR